MDDKRIEEMLLESCKPEMPQGMRDRVLRAARQDFAHQRKPRAALRWKPLLASIALAIVLLTNIMDQRTQAHLSALTDGHSTTDISTPLDLRKLLQQRRLDTLMAVVPGGYSINLGTRGDDSL